MFPLITFPLFQALRSMLHAWHDHPPISRVVKYTRNSKNKREFLASVSGQCGLSSILKDVTRPQVLLLSGCTASLATSQTHSSLLP